MGANVPQSLVFFCKVYLGRQGYVPVMKQGPWSWAPVPPPFPSLNMTPGTSGVPRKRLDDLTMHWVISQCWATCLGGGSSLSLTQSIGTLMLKDAAQYMLLKALDTSERDSSLSPTGSPQLCSASRIPREQQEVACKNVLNLPRERGSPGGLEEAWSSMKG